MSVYEDVLDALEHRAGNQPRPLTAREYYAAHAPDVPGWFIPANINDKEPPIPGPVPGETKEQMHNREHAYLVARCEWLQKNGAAKLIQWRWYYADQMVKYGA